MCHINKKMAARFVFLVSFLLLSLGGLELSPVWADNEKFQPVVPGRLDLITVRNMSVQIPVKTGWEKRVQTMPPSGKFYELERSLPNGNRVQIHIADFFGPEGALNFAKSFSDKKDAERLEWIIQIIESDPDPDVRRSEWVTIVREPQRRFGVVCRERHDLREEREDGILRFYWQDWMFFCVDPISRIPIQIDYAERYPVTGSPSPSFNEEASKFFDSIEFQPTRK